METRKRAWIIYTLWRLVFLAAAWFVIQLTTPIRGWWAIALAIVISGIFSILLLGRQRDAMSGSVYGFFRRINERIDASAAKEDFDDLPVDDVTGADLTGKSETEAKADSVDEQQDPGRL